MTMVRFQNDLSLPRAQRRNYKNVFNAFFRIWREEGPATFWRGFPAFSLRVMMMTGAQLTTMDTAKEIINNYRETETDLATRLASVALAGFVTAAVGLPFDNIKMKLNKMKLGARSRKMPYRGVKDCFIKSLKREGFRGLWVGFPMFYMVVAPHSMISLLIMDYLQMSFGSEEMKR